jgi:hypothetical protein
MHAKEPHPQVEYLAVNHDQLVGLIDQSAELLLRHEPVVSMMAEVAQLPSTTVWGHDLYDYDPNTSEGQKAVIIAQNAGRRVVDFSSQVTLRLLASEADSRGVDPAGRDAIREMVTSDQARKVMAVVNDSGRTFAQLAFKNPETGQSITVETVTLHGVVAPLARGLVLQIDDELLTRNLLVGHIEDSPIPVDPPLWIAQTVSPIYDATMEQMAEFFLQERDDKEGYAAVMVVFQQGLRGRSSEAVLADLRARYAVSDPAALSQVEEFVDVMRQRAVAAREQTGLMLHNPELTRPSSQELDEYTQLLHSLLGQA